MIPIVQRGVKADLPDHVSLRAYRSAERTNYNEMANGVPPDAGGTPFVLAVNSCRKRRYCPVPTRIRFDVAE